MGHERRIAELEPVPDHLEVLTTRQVASLTQRHEVTVRRALLDGELKGKRRGEAGRWFVKREDAIEWAVGA